MFTPAEDLNGPLDQLSLSPSSPFALRSKFTLKCSDGETSRSTPRCFTAPLVSSRTCWTRAAENSCEVSEIKGDSESSLIALKEGKPPADEEEWATMYKGQDKYDVPALRSMFSMPPHSTVNAAPLSIYIMALQYLQVARGAADVSLKEGLASASASTVYQKLPAMDRTNLEKCHSAHLHRSQSVLCSVSPPLDCDKFVHCVNGHDQWQRAVSLSSQPFVRSTIRRGG